MANSRQMEERHEFRLSRKVRAISVLWLLTGLVIIPAYAAAITVVLLVRIGAGAARVFFAVAFFPAFGLSLAASLRSQTAHSKVVLDDEGVRLVIAREMYTLRYDEIAVGEETDSKGRRRLVFHDGEFEHVCTDDLEGYDELREVVLSKAARVVDPGDVYTEAMNLLELQGRRSD